MLGGSKGDVQVVADAHGTDWAFPANVGLLRKAKRPDLSWGRDFRGEDS